MGLLLDLYGIVYSDDGGGSGPSVPGTASTVEMGSVAALVEWETDQTIVMAWTQAEIVLGGPPAEVAWSTQAVVAMSESDGAIDMHARTALIELGADATVAMPPTAVELWLGENPVDLAMVGRTSPDVVMDEGEGI